MPKNREELVEAPTVNSIEIDMSMEVTKKLIRDAAESMLLIDVSDWEATINISQYGDHKTMVTFIPRRQTTFAASKEGEG